MNIIEIDTKVVIVFLIMSGYLIQSSVLKKEYEGKKHKKKLPEKARLAADAILLVAGAERKEQVAASTADKKRVSAHAMNLQQIDNGVVIPSSGWKCCQCDQTENLWLNLTDGLILCGRRNWDGSGGNNHAIEHYKKIGYPLAVKGYYLMTMFCLSCVYPCNSLIAMAGTSVYSKFLWTLLYISLKTLIRHNSLKPIEARRSPGEEKLGLMEVKGIPAAQIGLY